MRKLSARSVANSDAMGAMVIAVSLFRCSTQLDSGQRDSCCRWVVGKKLKAPELASDRMALRPQGCAGHLGRVGLALQSVRELCTAMAGLVSFSIPRRT